MVRELQNVPDFWQEAVENSNVQQSITRRRNRFVIFSKLWEEEGFRPVTQVTVRSGRLLRYGEDDVRIMVEGRVKRLEESRVRRSFPDSELEMRWSRGAVIPLKDPKDIHTSTHFVATREGWTLFVKEGEKQLYEPVPVSIMVPRVHAIPARSLGSSIAISERELVLQ